jgi:hypothetical protein
MSRKRKEPDALSTAADVEFLCFLQEQLGPLSPWCQLTTEEKVSWQDLSLLVSDLDLLRRLFQNETVWSLPEQARLEYLDLYVDLPAIAATLKPSYAALKRLLVAGVTYIPDEQLYTVLRKRTLCEQAAKKGDLAVLQWARSQGCPWDRLTCWCAARGGHLAVLQWARSQGCPWDLTFCKRTGTAEVRAWIETQES